METLRNRLESNNRLARKLMADPVIRGSYRSPERQYSLSMERAERWILSQKTETMRRAAEMTFKAIKVIGHADFFFNLIDSVNNMFRVTGPRKCVIHLPKNRFEGKSYSWLALWLFDHLENGPYAGLLLGIGDTYDEEVYRQIVSIGAFRILIDDICYSGNQFAKMHKGAIDHGDSRKYLPSNHPKYVPHDAWPYYWANSYLLLVACSEDGKKNVYGFPFLFSSSIPTLGSQLYGLRKRIRFDIAEPTRDQGEIDEAFFAAVLHFGRFCRSTEHGIYQMADGWALEDNPALLALKENHDDLMAHFSSTATVLYYKMATFESTALTALLGWVPSTPYDTCLDAVRAIKNVTSEELPLWERDILGDLPNEEWQRLFMQMAEKYADHSYPRGEVSDQFIPLLEECPVKTVSHGHRRPLSLALLPVYGTTTSGDFSSNCLYPPYKDPSYLDAVRSISLLHTSEGRPMPDDPREFGSQL